MGVYFRYRVVDPETATAANGVLQEQAEFDALKDADCPHPWFWTQEDEDQMDFEYHLDIGEGNTKVNGPTPPEGRSQFSEYIASLFDTLHDNDNVEIEVSARSCAFGANEMTGEDFAYFTPAQVARIVNGGTALTGDRDYVLSRLPSELVNLQE